MRASRSTLMIHHRPSQLQLQLQHLAPSLLKAVWDRSCGADDWCYSNRTRHNTRSFCCLTSMKHWFIFAPSFDSFARSFLFWFQVSSTSGISVAYDFVVPVKKNGLVFYYCTLRPHLKFFLKEVPYPRHMPFSVFETLYHRSFYVKSSVLRWTNH